MIGRRVERYLDKKISFPGGGGGGGGGGAPALHISRKKGSFFCTQARNMGVKIPLQSTNYTRL